MQLDIEKMQNKIDEISVMLYQNREQEALEQISIFFGELKELTDNLQEQISEQDEQIVSYIMYMYQELYDAYMHKDMLGMADCLQERVMMVTELYRTQCVGRG